jgi:hypothetical protein
MSARVSVVGENVGQLTLSNGSEVIGIPAGEEQIRSYHPTGVVFDEMSHLPVAKQAYGIAHPVATYHAAAVVEDARQFSGFIVVHGMAYVLSAFAW